MEVKTEVTGQALMVSLKGTLDEASAHDFARQLEKGGQTECTYLLLDFSEVVAVTPAGLRSLLPYVQQAKLLKKILVFFNMNGRLQELVKNSGFDSLVQVVDSLNTAKQFIQNHPVKKK